MVSMQARVSETFEQHFGVPPEWIVRAPGRVNIIGEHTDYNDGFVLPMAIDRAVWIALRPRPDEYVLAYSLDFSEAVQFSLYEIAPPTETDSPWAEYLKGVAWALQESGMTLRGWEGVIGGDVPIGAGLSSSAAIELAAARAFTAISGIEWDAPKIAQLCQKAENQWVRVNSGIMDQMISAAGVEGRALLIDCRWLTFDPVPLPESTVAVIMDTSTRRELVTSAYNERRAQCEEAARFFNVPALRDVTMSQFIAVSDMLDPLVAKRARHVISENERTLRAAAAMRAGDPYELGWLMNASHASLRDDFEVTNDALNVIVEIAQGQQGCYGARMTGAGFGGCAVALVQQDTAASFAEAVAMHYHQITGLNAAVYISPAAQGASIVWGH